LQDTRTPVRMAGISIMANIILGVVLMKPLAHGGLALATSLASMLNLALLVRALRTKLGALGASAIARSAVSALVSSAIMGVGVWAVAQFMIPSNPGTLSGRLWGVAVSVAAGLCIYGAVAYILKSPEMIRVFAEVKKVIVKK